MASGKKKATSQEHIDISEMQSVFREMSPVRGQGEAG